MTEIQIDTSPRAAQTRARTDAIREIVLQAGKRLSQEHIEEVKGKLGVSRSTAYRMIKTFRACGATVDPNARPIGRPKGSRMLDATREHLVRDMIETFYFSPLAPTYTRLYEEIQERCRKNGLRPPNWRTVRSRVDEMEARSNLRRERAS
jgi:DtxR family transcriptional regulator, manganese transport regulator